MPTKQCLSSVSTSLYMFNEVGAVASVQAVAVLDDIGRCLELTVK